MNRPTETLLEHVPDIPRWVETRAAIMRGDYQAFGSMDHGGVLIVNSPSPLAAMIGRPEPEAFAQACAIMKPDVELLVMSEEVEHARAMLPDWQLHAMRLFMRDEDHAVTRVHSDPEIILFPTVDEAVRKQFPEPLRKELRNVTAVTAKRVDDAFVSTCQAGAITETWWDVGVDTLKSHRRRGYARACFHVFDAHMKQRGLRPIWGALTTNNASIKMARSLGFEPVDELYICLRKADDRDRNRAAARPQQAAHSQDSAPA